MISVGRVTISDGGIEKRRRRLGTLCWPQSTTARRLSMSLDVVADSPPANWPPALRSENQLSVGSRTPARRPTDCRPPTAVRRWCFFRRHIYACVYCFIRLCRIIITYYKKRTHIYEDEKKSIDKLRWTVGRLSTIIAPRPTTGFLTAGQGASWRAGCRRPHRATLMVAEPFSTAAGIGSRAVVAFFRCRHPISSLGRLKSLSMACDAAGCVGRRDVYRWPPSR